MVPQTRKRVMMRHTDGGISHSHEILFRIIEYIYFKKKKTKKTKRNEHKAHQYQ